MNSQEIMNLLRQLGTLAFGILVARGVLTADQSQAILSNLAVVVPALGTLGTVGWSVYAHWNMKKVPEDAKVVVASNRPAGPSINNMAVVLLAFGVSLFALADARAADVAPGPVKAPQQGGFQYPYDTSGFYAGVVTEGGGGSVSVSAPGVNTNSLISNQIGIYGMIGYAWNVPNSPMFMAIDQLIGYVDFNGAAQGLSYHGPLDFETRFIVGAPIDQIVAFFPNFGIKMPTFNMPTGFTAKSSKFYMGGALHVTDASLNFGAAQNHVWAVAPALIPAGIRTLLTNGSAVDAWTEVRFNDQGLCIQGATVGQNACGRVNTAIMAGLAYEFGVGGPKF